MRREVCRATAVVRDPAKLRAFREADALVIETYRLTAALPGTERFGLQSQARRAAVSTATNLVEGSARHSTADYCRYLEIARASACECGYLLELSVRLGYLPASVLETARRYAGLSAALLLITKRLRP